MKSTKCILCLITAIILSISSFVLLNNSNTESKTDFSLLSSGDLQTIAILDTGLNESLYEENKDRITKVINVTDDSENVTNELGHGTALASLLLGSRMMNLKGLLPDVRVVLIKITDRNGKCTFENLLKGLEEAEKSNASVINISLGSDISNDAVTKKISDLYKKNITIVAASGDYGDKDILFPANLSNVVSVASLDNRFNLSKFSNYNEQITCLFPGENMDLVSMDNGALEKTTRLTGTSYATVYASAYVAAIRDYCLKHNMLIPNNLIFSLLRKNDPLRKKRIITKSNDIFE